MKDQISDRAVTKIIQAITKKYTSNGYDYDPREPYELTIRKDMDVKKRKELLQRLAVSLQEFCAKPDMAPLCNGVVPVHAEKYKNSSGFVAIEPLIIYCKPFKNTKLFLPANIKPKVTDMWISDEMLVSHVKEYISKLEDDVLSEDDKLKIIHMLDMTIKDDKLIIPFNGSENILPAEFYEILTAAKLVTMLESPGHPRGGNKDIRKILGIPDSRDLKGSKICVYIPGSSNYRLVDYFVNITKDIPTSKPSTHDTDAGTLIVSVKSKVRGVDTNTIKFADMFHDLDDVDRWYKGYNTASRVEREGGQKSIAEAAITIEKSNMRNKFIAGIAIYSIVNLLNSQDRIKNKVQSVIKQKYLNGHMSIQDFETVLNMIWKALQSNSTEYKTELNTFIDNKPGKMYFDEISKIIRDSISSKSKDVEITITNFAFLCEKILEEISSDKDKTNYNFYDMFYDQVLCRRHVAYAITKLTVSNDKVKYLTFQYFSAVNFQKYKKWIELKSKNSVNKLAKSIGLNI